nr:CPS3 protein [Isodon rubescens]
MDDNYRIFNKNLITNAARRGTPQVCSGNGGFEPQPFDKNKIEECITKTLQSIGDGRISASAYDTAWIALIKDVINRDLPLFPSSLEWIVSNQLRDGSWGDRDFFVPCDRLLSTLACVVALRTWNVYPNETERGILFVKKNISKLEDGDDVHTTLGFEILFPALLERARNLGIEGLPYDDPTTQKICAERDLKLDRISKELIIKEVPASLLLILEGLKNLNWENILKLQSPDGSFLGSPATTAFVFMETKDESCLSYLKKTVQNFGGGAPSLYPVDILTRLLAVDRLQRLGISRFFHSQIEDCLSYIYRFWTGNGVFSGRDSEFCDVNDTSMAFRLLRLHGYNVSPNVFTNFKKGNEFSVYGDDEVVDSPSTMLNLYRASEVRFAGETILEEAKEFSHNFLQQRQGLPNQVLDNCLISKNLHTEIKYELETPWFASLPRLEARFFIERYNAVDEVCIGKSLYRLPDTNEGTYLELAKLDYNRCQEQHQMEWNHMQQWYEDCNLEEFGISKNDILEAHFLAAASIFEAERSGERVAWVKTQILSHILSTYYFIKQSHQDHKPQLSTEKAHIAGQPGKGFKNVQRIISILFEALTQMKKDALEGSNGDISDDLLHEAWGGWLKKLGEGETEERQEAELIARTINICGGHILSKQILSHHEYKTLSQLTNQICHNLHNSKMIGKEMENEMQLLVQLVLQESSNGISKAIKQTFLVVAKAFYYRAYFSAKQIENHVSIILFEQLV